MQKGCYFCVQELDGGGGGGGGELQLRYERDLMEINLRIIVKRITHISFLCPAHFLGIPSFNDLPSFMLGSISPKTAEIKSATGVSVYYHTHTHTL